MDKKDRNKKERFAITIIFLSPFPFSSNCLGSFFAKYMNKKSEETKQAYSNDIRIFRLRQIDSAKLTIILFSIALFISYLSSRLHLAHISWLPIISATLLTHSVFHQLGWELTFSGDTLLEMMNKWCFRIIYSIGVILLFLTMMR